MKINRNLSKNQILRPSTAEGKSKVLGGPGDSQQRPISSQQRHIADQLSLITDICEKVDYIHVYLISDNRNQIVFTPPAA